MTSVGTNVIEIAERRTRMAPHLFRNGSVMTNVKSRAAFAALAMIAAALLSGCGGNPIKNAVDDAVGNAVEGGVEKAIENAAGDDVDININVDGSEVGLPSNFPSGIPLPDGAKLISSFGTPEGWNLAYVVADTGPANGLVEKYKADSSWTLGQESVTEGFCMWTFTGTSYGVVILASGDGTADAGITISVVPNKE